MFWKFHSGAVSHVDTLLDKEGVTLQEVLEQEDIIQECKSQNKKLVEFLTKQEVLAELLDLILQEPSAELDERLRFKLPNIASEVITCDVAQINEKLSSDTSLLDKLYAFLESSPPLNPLLTSFFSKTFGILITRRPEQVIEYIKSKPKFTSLLLTHLATSAVMDLLLRLITCVDGTENKQNILTWLNEEKLIERVLALFSPPEGGGIEEDGEAAFKVGEQHDNAGQLLVEIIRSCRDCQLISPPAEKFLNPLLVTAESEETVKTLLGHMLDGPPVETCLINGVEVLMSLLEVRRPAPQGGFYPYSSEQDTVNCLPDIERQEAVVASTVQSLIPRLPQLTSLLLSPPYKPPVSTTAGVLAVPLGRSRLAITKLLAALLNTNSPSLNKALAEANTLTVLLDLFFSYNLNNFLHAQVQSCLHSVIFWTDVDQQTSPEKTPDTTEVGEASLETPKITEAGEVEEAEAAQHPLESESFDNPALVHLLTQAGLMDRLITAWSSPAVPSVSYMGHVTKICNDLVEACGNTTTTTTATTPPACRSRTLLLQLLAKLPEETQETWAGIVEGKLSETNKMNEIKPTDEKRTLSSDDEDSDFTDIQFPQDTPLGKMFSDYQMQEMSENFIDSFGFQDDEFTESDMSVSRGMRKLNNVNLLMQTDDSTKQAIFDSVCEQRIKRFGSDQDDQDDPWADKTAEISFSKSSLKPSDAGQDSSEEDEPAPSKMEVDNDQDPWDTISAPAGGAGGQVAMDTGSPWDAPPPQQVDTQETGWADFATFPSSGNDSGASDIIEKQPGEVMSVEDRPEEGGDTWRPSMASSPEATMLDVTAEDVDEEEEKEDHKVEKEEVTELKSDAKEEVKEEEKEEKEVEKEEKEVKEVKEEKEKEEVKEDKNAGVNDERLLGEVESSEKDVKDELADNFAFLSEKGLIGSDNSNISQNAAPQTQETSEPETKGDVGEPS